MSIETKTKLKKGAVALGIIVTIGLFLFGGSFAYTTMVSGKVDRVQAQVSEQATVIESVKQDTHWIRTYLCSKDKSPNCPIPTN